jgi:hypothetical protein
MRKYRALYLVFALLCLFCVALTMPVRAQAGAATTAPITPMVDLLTKIGIVAGVIAAALQGLKKFVPALGGWYAVALNFILSLALSYAASPSIDPQFFISAIGTALAAAGIHSFLRPADVISTTAPPPGNNK